MKVKSDKLRKAIINKNPWTRSHADLIEKEGIDQAVTTIFKKAAGEFGGSSTAAQLAAKDAIEFMKNFGWKYPTQEALSYIYSNPWLAMGYAARSIKDWVPDLHPIIEQTPAALAAYYSIMVKELRRIQAVSQTTSRRLLNGPQKVMDNQRMASCAICLWPCMFVTLETPVVLPLS